MCVCVSSLRQLVQHPLLVFDFIPEAAELLLMSLPVVLQLLLQCFLEKDQHTQSQRDTTDTKQHTLTTLTTGHLDLLASLQSADVLLLLLQTQHLVSLL